MGAAHLTTARATATATTAKLERGEVCVSELSPRGFADRPRVAFYSHDTMGLGHLRRNLLIAQTFACSPLRAVPLMVAGMREANAFSLPPGTDCLTLPALRKDELGQYQARHLDVSLTDVIAVRAGAIRAAVEAFNPDLMIVDKVPRGAMGELDDTMRFLRTRRKTHCILGLRDVLDDPKTVHNEWVKADNDGAIDEYYDQIWVYGDPNVYDVARECGFSAPVRRKLRFTGFLDQRPRLALTTHRSPETSYGPFVLCSVGGGQDGALLAKVFAQTRLPAGLSGLIVTGSFMPVDLLCELRRIAGRNPRMHVLGFVSEPAMLVRDAHRVVIMGGYNSVCEALSFEKRTLVVPRISPRTEQLIRAEALRTLGLVDVLTPEHLTPSAVERWLTREVAPPKVHGRVNFGGLPTVQLMLQSMVGSRGLKATSRAI